MRAAPRDRGRGPRRIVFPGGCFGRTRPGGMEEVVVPLDDVNDIRAMDAAGVPRAEIARRLGLSRNTVAKYADMADMSPAAPEARVRRRRALSREDAAWVDAVLEADLGAPRKQRHSARRIYDRLVAERGCGGSCSTEVSTDMRSSYAAPLSEVGAASHNRYGEADAGEDELGMVNTLHERLRGFRWRFRGVSTRRLQRYLWWFCWEEQARRSDASREAMLRSHVANGSYELTRRDLEEEPQPFWDFWESRDESDVSNLV